jgi:hypothetical protein
MRRKWMKTEWRRGKVRGRGEGGERVRMEEREEKGM